jgi:6-phosphofructokinase 1
MSNIAILCSGGDVSGMNAALKRFVEYSYIKGLTPYFVDRGYEGLIDGKITKANYSDVSGIISRGGTKIHTSRSIRFKESRYRAIAIENLKKHNIGHLIVMGGDGSFKGMHKLSEESSDISVAGIPSTIDNDIAGTEYCLGVDTALNMIKYAIDSVRDTASSYGRAFVVETMGRGSGYLALVTALTSGAEMCLIPELPYNLDAYREKFLAQKENGRKYFLAIIAEALNKTAEIEQWFEQEIGIEATPMVLGHIQRGGNPTVYDRLMAFDFVTYAIDGLLGGKRESVVCYSDGGFGYKKISDVAFKDYTISDTLLQLGKEYGHKMTSWRA